MFYRVSELTSDMYASVDSAVASIERQIRKNKTRLEKRLRDGAIEREIKPFNVPAEDAGEEEFKIVRNKKFYIAPMSVEEAILQMNLLEHEFFVFRNTDERDAFSVVYPPQERRLRPDRGQQGLTYPAPLPGGGFCLCRHGREGGTHGRQHERRGPHLARRPARP